MTIQEHKQSTLKEFIELGAAIEHERWARWQDYVHSQCVNNRDDGDSRRTIPKELYERAKRQINTPYEDLSEEEKESDRKQVRYYNGLLSNLFDEAYQAGKESIMKDLPEDLNKKIASHYPEDVWPDPRVKDQAKDSVAAHLMRTLAADVAYHDLRKLLEKRASASSIVN